LDWLLARQEGNAKGLSRDWKEGTLEREEKEVSREDVLL